MANSTAHSISAMQPNIDAQSTQNPVACGVILQEEKCLGYINLRIKAEDDPARSIVKSIIDLDLPALGLCNSSDTVTAMCFSSSEWLIITESGEETSITETLQDKLSDYHSLVADVTGGTTALSITGQHAQDLLEKGTYVDLDDSVFNVNQLYATQIAHAPATIIKNGHNDFSLIIRRSFANHIAEWALDGGREFGVSFS